MKIVQVISLVLGVCFLMNHNAYAQKAATQNLTPAQKKARKVAILNAIKAKQATRAKAREAKKQAIANAAAKQQQKQIKK